MKIENQHTLIRVLLDAGAQLENVDKNNETAFLKSAQLKWFLTYKKKMENVVDHPVQTYDAEIFMDKRTQASVDFVWLKSGGRSRATSSLCMWLLFVAVATIVALSYTGRNDPEVFSFEEGMKEQIVNEEFDGDGHFSFHDVASIEEFFGFMNGAFIPALWSTNYTYFNESNLPEVSPFAKVNGLAGLLGRPRIRAQRSKDKACEVESPNILQDDGLCFVEVDRAHLDMDPFMCEDLNVTFSQTSFIGTRGRYDRYPPGGHSIILPEDEQEARDLVAKLKRCNFISLDTRVVFVEFLLFNRNVFMFTNVRLFVEFSVAGSIVPGQQWETLRLISYFRQADFAFIPVEICLCLLFLYYLRKEIIEFMTPWPQEYQDDESVPFWWTVLFKRKEDANNRMAQDSSSFKILLPIPIFNWTICVRKTRNVIRPYFMNSFNLFDFCWMISFVAVYGINAYLTVHDNKEIGVWVNRLKEDRVDDADIDEYLDPTDLVFLASMRKRLFAILLFFVWIKILEYIQVRKQFAIAVYVIGAMAYKVLPFLASFFIFLSAFAMYDYVLYGTSSEAVNSLGMSLLNSYKVSLGDIDFDNSLELDRFTGVFVTVMASFLLTTLILNLLIAVMSEAYEEVKETAEAHWCYIQFNQILSHERAKRSSSMVSPSGVYDVLNSLRISHEGEVI